MAVSDQHDCCLEASRRLTPEDGRTRLNLADGTGGVIISFCPWCGADLRPTAALLRRRKSDPLKLRD